MENIIGNDIHRRREEKGISLRSFANSVQISATYQSQIERGQVPATQALENIYSRLGPTLTQSAASSVRQINDIVSSQPSFLYVLQKLSETGFSIWCPVLFESYYQIALAVHSRKPGSSFLGHFNNLIKIINSLEESINHLTHVNPRIPQAGEEILINDLRMLHRCMDNNTAKLADDLKIKSAHLNALLTTTQFPSEDIAERIIERLKNYCDYNPQMKGQYFAGKKFTKKEYYKPLLKGIYGIRVEFAEHPYVQFIVKTYIDSQKNTSWANDFVFEQINLLPADLPDLSNPDQYLELISNTIINSYRKLYRKINS